MSIFAWNHEDDFFGGYDHGRKAGIAVVADHHVAPGKKFFEWGNGNEGLLWDKILTDTDGPYLELMAGGYSDNQPDYSWVQPGEVKVVEQFFYPIRELGGIKNANIDAAVNLEVSDKGVARVALNTTALFRDARVTLTAGEEVLFEQPITISPEKPFVKELALPEGTRAEDLRVSLMSADKRELIGYRPTKPKNSPMPKPVVPHPLLQARPCTTRHRNGCLKRPKPPASSAWYMSALPTRRCSPTWSTSTARPSWNRRWWSRG